MSKQVFRDIKKSGFTLIELLTVIAVIGLLSSIILVSVGKMREKVNVAASFQFSANVHHALGDSIVGEWNFENNMINLTNNTDCLQDLGGAYSFSDVGSPHLELKKYLNANNGLGCGCYPDYNLVSGLNGSETKLTIEAWIYINNFTSNTWVVVKADAYGLMLNSTSSNLALYDGTNMQYFSFPPVTIGEWHHILMTYSKPLNKAEFYIDGKLAMKQNIVISSIIDRWASSPCPSPGMLGILDFFWRGKIDEVRIYKDSIIAN